MHIAQNNKIANNNTCHWEIIWSEVFQPQHRTVPSTQLQQPTDGPRRTVECLFICRAAHQYAGSCRVGTSMYRFMPGGILICRPAYRCAGRSMRWIFKWDTPRQMGHKSESWRAKGGNNPVPVLPSTCQRNGYTSNRCLPRWWRRNLIPT